MAKGLRSKQKKRLRAEMRRTVGAAFEQEKLKETQEHLSKRLAAAGESLSVLARLRKKLSGGTAGEDDMETEESALEAESKRSEERKQAPSLVNHYSKMSIPGEDSGRKGKKKSKKQVYKVARNAKVSKRSTRKATAS
mmetsp:Transcript_2031/g.8963  ORF Transcript_2031/g.8963 Transcript_2031/m.8963 type:complete len:138 (-) Transcript_2031:928-1341(-)|eukprot:scaffold1108_cov260-Pinguiococcus_pyrenoidosus.AAC.7